MKKLFYLFMLFFSVTLFSCTSETEPSGVDFNVEEYNKQKELWLSLGIKNYLFDYSFSGYMPEYIIGNTVVENENGTATVTYRTDGKEVPKENNSRYYVENIDKIFEILESEYKQALKEVNAEKYYAVIFDCKYNETYGYPEYISLLSFRGPNYTVNRSLVGDRNDNEFSFRVKQFNVTQ